MEIKEEDISIDVFVDFDSYDVLICCNKSQTQKQAEKIKQQILDNQEILQYFKNKFPYQYHQAKLDLENKIC